MIKLFNRMEIPDLPIEIISKILDLLVLDLLVLDLLGMDDRQNRKEYFLEMERLADEDKARQMSNRPLNPHFRGSIEWYIEERRCDDADKAYQQTIEQDRGPIKPWRPNYYNLLLVSKVFNSRFKELDILIPMVGSYSKRQFNRICLKMIMEQLNMEYILLSPKPSYHRTDYLTIPICEIKDNNKKKEPRNPTNKEIKQNIYSFIKENRIPCNSVFRGATGLKEEFYFKGWRE